MPKLLLRFNNAVLSEYDIGAKRSVLTVGRKADNDIVVENPAVSSHHCRIVFKGETYYVEDLESTNGTSVNGKRVIKTGLHHNDVIGVVKHTLLFVDEAAEVAPPLETGPAASSGEALAKKSAAAAAESEKVGKLRVLKGALSGPVEWELKGLSTYIGTADRAQVRIKAGGTIFGQAPGIAASIHRKPEGYVAVAVVEGYGMLNGLPLSGTMRLKDGDILDFGATTIQFILR